MVFVCLPVIFTKVALCIDLHGISRFSTVEILAQGITLKLFSLDQVNIRNLLSSNSGRNLKFNI
jgi:hypothetical protein